jgi:hypothetical protein
MKFVKIAMPQESARGYFLYPSMPEDKMEHDGFFLIGQGNNWAWFAVEANGDGFTPLIAQACGFRCPQSEDEFRIVKTFKIDQALALGISHMLILLQEFVLTMVEIDDDSCEADSLTLREYFSGLRVCVKEFLDFIEDESAHPNFTFLNHA